MNTSIPIQASAHYGTGTEPVTARWAGHIDTVVVEVGRNVSLHMKADDARQLAAQLTAAVDEADTLAEFDANRAPGVRDAGSGAAAGEYPHHLLDGDTDGDQS